MRRQIRRISKKARKDSRKHLTDISSPRDTSTNTAALPVSGALGLLSERLRRWLSTKNWTLRPVQEKTVPLVLRALEATESPDFVISAPTASGKTEAVFFPIATLIDEWETESTGAKVLYVCPLKALIDQQAARLGDGILSGTDHPVTPWHGAAKRAGKKSFENDPRGVVIITPESLEAQFINRPTKLDIFYRNLHCIVIDEFHAFFNSPRGYQLLSQLNRLERLVCKRRIPRIALSATFNEETRREIREQLRPQQPDTVQFIEDETSERSLHFQVRSFRQDAEPATAEASQGSRDEKIVQQVLSDFSFLASAHNGMRQKGLLFVNSRQQAEIFAERLRAEGHANGIEFLLHHGSLSDEVKQDVVKALLDEKRAAVAVCTPTLELGIDIGTIVQVGQVDPSSTVAALHQRLGRAGRRHGQVGRLIVYVREMAPERSGPLADLHVPTFQTLAQISLVQKKAYEAPDRRPAHLSTLIQQVLSMAAQLGGVRIQDVRSILVEDGPFSALRAAADPDDHLRLLFRRLWMADLLEPRIYRNDEYALTQRAQRLMSHHDFYAAFETGSLYTICSPERVLGTIPLAQMYRPGDRIIYSGKLWMIVSIRQENRTVNVVPAASGAAPIFPGDPIPPSQAVLSEMQAFYQVKTEPKGIDLCAETKSFLDSGRRKYRSLGLTRSSVVATENGVLLFPWLDQRGQMSLLYAMRHWGQNAMTAGVAIFVENASESNVRKLLKELADKTKGCPRGDEAIRSASSVLIEKHDHWLSPYLQRWNAATFRLDMDSVPLNAAHVIR